MCTVHGNGQLSRTHFYQRENRFCSQETVAFRSRKTTCRFGFGLGLGLHYHCSQHRRSQDFVWGCTFFLKKLTTFFLVTLKRRSKTSKSTTPTSKYPKNVLKLTLALPGGCTWCAAGVQCALTNFPCKLRLIFFSALGVQVHLLHPWLRLWQPVLN